MVKRLTVAFVFCMFVLFLFAGGAFAASKAGKGATTLKSRPQADRMRGDEVAPVTSPLVKYSVPSSAAPVVFCTDVWPQMQEAQGLGEYLLDHEQVGSSWYDFQKNGSMGRMISVDDNRYRNIGWMYSPAIYDNPNVDIRYVYWNGLDPAGLLFNTTGMPVDGGEREGGGYCNQDHMYDGKPAAIYHRSGAGKPPDGGDITPWTMFSVDDDVFSGIFARDFDIPDEIINSSSGEDGSWPKFDVKYDADDEKDYIHVVMTEGNTAGGVPVMIAYVRCYLTDPDGVEMVCDAPMANAVAATYTFEAGEEFDPKYLVSHIDSSCSITPVVVSSPVSKRIAIAYLPSSCDESCNYGTDVAYVESMNSGNDWMTSTGWPPPITRVVDYGCDYPTEEMGFADVSACYDYEDSLHLVWCTVGRADNAGYYYPGIGKLWHWSKEHGVGMVTSNITEFTDAGAHNGVITKPTVASLDPIYHPTEPTAVYLYMIWTQFDSGDVSAAEFGNGELYGAASNDGGRTFGNVWNLTQTRTPGCLPGDCVSEHWSSLATNMQNGELHIEYVCDKDAGFCIQDGTAWLDNPIMYMNLKRWAIGERCEGAYTRVDPGSFHTPPIKITPGGSRTLTLKLSNVGNVGMAYTASASDPSGCLTGSFTSTLPITESVNLTFDVNGAGACNNKFIQAGINLILCNETEVFIPVHAIVANDYYECPNDPVTYDTIDIPAMRVYANANSLEWMEDKSLAEVDLNRVFFQGGSFVATKIGADKMVGRWYNATNDARSSVRDKLYYSYCTYDNDYDCHVLYTKNIFIFGPLDPPDYLLYNTWWWWEWSKQIKVCELPDNRMIVMKYIRVKRHDPPTWWPNPPVYTSHEDTYIGMAMDFDCPFDTLMDSEESARNWGGYDEVKQIAWQQGLYNPLDVDPNPEYANYYCAMALANPSSSAPVTPYGAHVVKNNQYLYPQGGWGWDDAQLYDLAATAGNSVQDADSALDRTVVITAAEIPGGTAPNADYSFVVVEVATPNGLADMQALVDTARVLVVREKAHGFPIICGDIKLDGKVDLSDVLYLLNFLFKGGTAVPCPTNRADAKVDGKVDLSDALYLLNFLFKNGPEPACPGIYY